MTFNDVRASAIWSLSEVYSPALVANPKFLPVWFAGVEHGSVEDADFEAEIIYLREYIDRKILAPGAIVFDPAGVRNSIIQR